MIQVQCEHGDETTALAGVLENAAQHALFHLKQDEEASLTIVLSTDEKLQQLNREHRGIDAPTDVLSFPADEEASEEGERYLGDILISLERAKAQAWDGGHPLQQEVELLTVHAVLHLLGYDHADEGEKQKMWQAQEHILASLGNPLRPN